MSEVNELPPHGCTAPLPDLLAGAFDGFRAALGACQLPGLRPSHYRVMSLIPAGGLRLGELATRAAITKTGIGQFIKYLEREGYVDLANDPGDNRAKIATLTAAGEAAVRMAGKVIADTEKRWSEVLGVERYRELRRALAEVASLPGGTCP